MTNSIFFKIRSIPKLLTFDELRRLSAARKAQSIKVIDTKSQRNYCTTYKVILQKFR